jgi:hypothetical protein
MVTQATNVELETQVRVNQCHQSKSQYTDVSCSLCGTKFRDARKQAVCTLHVKRAIFQISESCHEPLCICIILRSLGGLKHRTPWFWCSWALLWADHCAQGQTPRLVLVPELSYYYYYYKENLRSGQRHAAQLMPKSTHL